MKKLFITIVAIAPSILAVAAKVTGVVLGIIAFASVIYFAYALLKSKKRLQLPQPTMKPSRTIFINEKNMRYVSIEDPDNWQEIVSKEHLEFLNDNFIVQHA